MRYIDEGHIKYLEDDDGVLHFIANRSILKRIKAEEDWKYKKWEEYNTSRALRGYEPIEDYGEFIIDVLGSTLSIEDALIIEEEANKKKYSKYLKNTNVFETMIRDNFGSFYFSIYNRLLKIDLKPQYRIRFIYLCTFMNYDNKLEFGNGIGNTKLMVERDLIEVLGLSQNETIRTKKALIESDLISIEDDKTISINKRYAIKGKITKRDSRESVRIMENGLREIYAKAKPSEHKRLDIFIKVLPYVNYNHNVLCKNPNESDVDKVEALTLSELCEIVGYDKTKSVRLKNELLKIKVDEQMAFGVFETGYGKRLYVNPKVYYKGRDLESLRALINMFNIKK